MRLKHLTCSLLLLGSLCSYGQDKADTQVLRRTSVFAEVLGNAPLVSLGIDYLTATQLDYVKFALTLSATHHFDELEDFVLAPQVNLLIGREWMAELGIGATVLLTFPEDWVMVPRLGVRYQKESGGLMARLAFTPIVRIQGDAVFLPSPGFSVGYTL